MNSVIENNEELNSDIKNNDINSKDYDSKVIDTLQSSVENPFNENNKNNENQVDKVTKYNSDLNKDKQNDNVEYNEKDAHNLLIFIFKKYNLNVTKDEAFIALEVIFDKYIKSPSESFPITLCCMSGVIEKSRNIYYTSTKIYSQY
jgi:hypothetical protein